MSRLSSADETTTDAEEAPLTDDLRDALVAELRAALGDAVVDSYVAPGRDVWVRVSVDAWADAARACRERLGLTYFCYLSAIDWLPSPFGKNEGDTPPTPPPADSSELEHGVTGGATRMQLLARHVKPWPGLVDVEAMPGEPDDDEDVEGEPGEDE